MWSKRGTDKILSVYWFAILFIVAGGVVYMATLYYGEPYDVRGIEANFMINHVADCFSQGGILIPGWENINENNIIERCNFNFNIEETYGWNNDQYYLEVSIREFNQGELKELAKKGNSNLLDFCDKEGKKLPVCFERSFYTLDNDDNQYEIKIKSIVRKTEKNVV